MFVDPESLDGGVVGDHVSVAVFGEVAHGPLPGGQCGVDRGCAPGRGTGWIGTIHPYPGFPLDAKGWVGDDAVPFKIRPAFVHGFPGPGAGCCEVVPGAGWVQGVVDVDPVAFGAEVVEWFQQVSVGALRVQDVGAGVIWQAHGQFSGNGDRGFVLLGAFVNGCFWVGGSVEEVADVGGYDFGAVHV